jgi:hypothetical protein
MPGLSLRRAGPESKVLGRVYGGPYASANLYLNDAGRSSVHLPDGLLHVEPTHDPAGRDVAYLAAQSGAGKGTFIKAFLERYHQLWPERPCLLVSKLDYDATLAPLEEAGWLRRILLESLVESPLRLEELGAGAAVVFDDTEAASKAEEAEIRRSAELIATQGRHQAITLIWSQHNLTNSFKSRTLINEAHWVIVWPAGSSYMQLTRLCSAWLGLDPKQCAWVRKCRSRWVALYKRYPCVAVWETGAALLADVGRVPSGDT